MSYASTILLNFEETLMLRKNFLKKLDKILEFLPSYKKLRNKNSNELYAIANIDETPIFLNVPTSTTVQTIESMKVNIRTQGQEDRGQ